MDRFQGTKTLSAMPMNRGEYNLYRGWTIPANENPLDAGYLVEYEDGGAANDSRHAGYISWSPKDVFERTYKRIAEMRVPSGLRKLTDHMVNPANDQLEINVIDAPGSGGANHVYHVVHNPSGGDGWVHPISFQNGPIAEAGVNGLTHEALLAILCDRMRGFQSGPYASSDNAEALAHMEAAQTALQRRTLARMARGVEGTHAI